MSPSTMQFLALESARPGPTILFPPYGTPSTLTSMAACTCWDIDILAKHGHHIREVLCEMVEKRHQEQAATHHDKSQEHLELTVAGTKVEKENKEGEVVEKRHQEQAATHHDKSQEHLELTVAGTKVEKENKEGEVVEKRDTRNRRWSTHLPRWIWTISK